jgi:hypothetical protein
MKTYYPEGYYNRVGYAKSQMSASSSTIAVKQDKRKKVDALGQRVRERFNE